MPNEAIQLVPPSRPKSRKWLFRFMWSTLLASACAGGAGYYAWQLRSQLGSANAELGETRGVRRECAAALTQVTGERDSLRNAATSCEKDRADKTRTAAEMKSDLTATRAELEELQRLRKDVETRLAAHKQLSDSLRKMIDAGQLNVVFRKGDMRVQLPAAVLFDSGRADLSRAGEMALMEVAVGLKTLPNRRFTVVGYTDDRPLKGKVFASNWELSMARALTVTRFLIETGMKPTHLLPAGQAEYDPVASNATPAGRKANRRIEIILLPELQEPPPAPRKAHK